MSERDMRDRGDGGARSYTRPRGRATPGPPPPAGAVDGDLRARHRPFPHPRPRPRDRRALLLRHRRRDQRVRGRISDPEHRARARCRRCAVLGLRPRLQRAPGQGRAEARVARRVEPLLARATRAGRPDGAVHRDLAVDHGRLRLRTSRRRALARPFPDRRAARPVGNRGRDPQQLRPFHRSGAHAGLLEYRDHRRTGDRRPARRRDQRPALRLRVLDPHRDGDSVPPATPVASRPGRPASGRDRLARPGGAPDAGADGPDHDRPRADQLQRRRRHVLCGAPDRPFPGAERDQRGVSPLHAPAGDLLGRRGDGALPVARAARDGGRLRRLPQNGDDRNPANRVSARSGERRLRGARRADRATRVPARRLQAAADACRGGVARCVRARSRLQRLHADAQSRVLQPAVALDPDVGRARQPRAERGARCGVLPARNLGPAAVDVAREHRRLSRALRPVAPAAGLPRPARERFGVRAHRRGLRRLRRGRLRRLAWARRELGRRLVGQIVSVGTALVAGGRRVRAPVPGARRARAAGLALAAPKSRSDRIPAARGFRPAADRGVASRRSTSPSGGATRSRSRSRSAAPRSKAGATWSTT